jgi:nicotinamide phosphoribosyltransferase
MKYYNTDEMTAFSVPASEHSTITSWGKNRETDAYRNMLKQFGGEYPIVSVVSDSYDIYNAVENIWGNELKDEVIKCGSMLVVRPDSGRPEEVVSRIAMLLDSTFGSTINSKGYKVLNNVRILQGDGITEDSIRDILATLRGYGFSSDNAVFGQGGALLQQVNRDTQKFAMKASAAFVDGEWVDVFKDPITDSGKRSKKGRITLWKDANDNLVTAGINEHKSYVCDMLDTVYENGKIIKEYTFDEVRAQVEATT